MNYYQVSFRNIFNKINASSILFYLFNVVQLLLKQKVYRIFLTVT